MKLFHLSDLHIGLKLMNHDLTEDQRHVFKQVAEYAEEEQPDAILIAGDIYDKAVPAAEAMELFDEFLNLLVDASPNSTIMIISGNHDSAPRVNTYRSILAKRKLHMIGNPPSGENEYIEKVTLKDAFGDVNFYLLPFVKPSMIRQIVGSNENGNLLSYDESVRRLIEREKVDTQARNVLVSHQFYLSSGTNADDVERMDNEILSVGNIDEVDGDILKLFDYAALGHIHKPMQVGGEFYRYCGTPMACSVSEAGQSKGIIVAELGEKGTRSTRVLPLLPLHEVRIIEDFYANVLQMRSEDYVTIILKDKEDLNVIDMQDRIRHLFPNYLEIRRTKERHLRADVERTLEKDKDPYELCLDFAEFDDEEKRILMDVINVVKGV